MKHILAVDIGTTSAKAMVVSQKGEALSSAQEYYSTSHPQPGYAEQDPDHIFQAVKNIIKSAVAKFTGKIDGVSFSSAMHSIMAVDEKGTPLTPLVIWADLRSKGEATRLLEANGQEIYEETGTPIHAFSPLCKLLWWKYNDPNLFLQAAKFIGIKEFIWFKLFNEFAVDHSVASSSGLLNTTTRSWSAKALQAIGISERYLSRPCSIYETFKKIDPTQAKEMGIATDIPWALGANDGCLANLGSGATDGNTLSLTIGTSGAVRKSTNRNFPDPLGRTFNYLLDEDNLVTGGATNNGAILVQWYSENFLKEKVDVKLFGERAATVATGADGLIFLPYLLGERAPVYDPDSTGVFFGVCKRHTTEHFMRAILEGIGFALLSIAEIVEENSGGCNHIIASGGFIKSDHWVQMMCNIFGKEIRVRGSEDASSLGAALVGFKALGVETMFEFPKEKVFHPDYAEHKVYQGFFTVFKKLYPHLAADFKMLHQAGKRS